MEETGITELEEFVGVAEYLAEQGFIAEGVNRYEFFVVTLRGIGAGSGAKAGSLAVGAGYLSNHATCCVNYIGYWVAKRPLAPILTHDISQRRIRVSEKTSSRDCLKSPNRLQCGIP